VILDHYRREAESFELDPSSTMRDQVVREREIDAIVRAVALFAGEDGGGASLLEVGCGNGFLLELLRARFPTLNLTGSDYSPEMVALASRRAIDRCEVRREDVRALSFADGAFDLVVSERCLINLLGDGAQEDAIRELHRVLRLGGHVVLIEAFTGAHANLTRARQELGLEPIPVPHHNRWFDDEEFSRITEDLFVVLDHHDLPPRNFLSAHYFVSRVLYPAVTQREVLHNTEFVRFFQFLPPIGEFAPVQLLLLERPGR
jgi:ubiquinone/menaquinone biosynthesis C-methylase UbiE